MQPLVSIVTPSFNQAGFLERTILSVLNQSYAHIEYIIIDGGSTDGSADIISRYSDRITYWVSEPDKGQADAINKGFARCKGELFAYLNSDDVLEQNAVAQIVNAYVKERQAAVIYGKCSTIDANDQLIESPQGAMVNFDWLLHNGMLPRIYQPACFFNTKWLSRKPLFDARLHYVMDYELLLSLLRQHHAHFIPAPVARYRVHAAAKTSAQASRMYEEKMKVQRAYGAPVFLRQLKHRIRKLLG